MFTKINLRQGYNNIRIKKDDKQKTAFSISKNAYKPVVIFFRLTNLLATFETIINNLLRNLIKIEDVVTFINDMIIEIETEKYIQKVREVGFLEVVINSDRVKIKKEKVQKVMDQSVLRGVEDV